MKGGAGSARTLLVVVAIAGGAAWLALRFQAGRHETTGAAGASVAAPARAPEPGAPASGSAFSASGDPVAGRAEEAHRPFAAFNAWSARYLNETDAAARMALVPEGVRAADLRRWALHDLIAADPELALAMAVPWGARRGLPAAVEKLLEVRVSGVGDLRVVGALPPDFSAEAGFVPVRREAALDGATYEAHVYGRRSGLGTRRAIPLHGIVVGGRMAVLDGPVRLLEAGEPAATGRRVEEFCAVSGLPAGPAIAPPGQEVIGADLGDRVVYLCSAGHIAALTAELLRAEGSPEGAGNAAPTPAAAADRTSGEKRVLYIRVRFADQPPGFEPQTQAGVLATVETARAFLAENSGGRFSIVPTVTPVYALPQTAGGYAGSDAGGYAKNVLDAARAVAAAPGTYPGNAGLPAFDFRAYDFEVVRYSGGPGSFSGQAYVGDRGLWMKSDSGGVLAHELGHNLGLWHANAWLATDPQTITGPGRNSEYGDIFDAMGRDAAAQAHFNAYQKARLAWLPESAIAPVASGGGVWRLQAHDLAAALEPGSFHAIKVRRDEDRDLWLEFRQHPGWAANRWLMNGIGLRWDPWLSSNGGTQLLDATPLTPDGLADSALVVGRTFSDPVADVHVTPLAAASGAIEVDVRFGPFPGNRAPVVALAASTLATLPGLPVTFTASASDPDGDALAYAWDFGDRTFGANAPAVSPTWFSAGDRRVRVTVSDRRGLTASASVVVRVGPATGSVVRGHVTDAAGRPVADVRVTNGLPPEHAGHRQALTDTDGSYALTGVTAGSWTVGAARPGWVFARRLFLNPVVVPGDAGDISFVGQPVGFRVAGTVRAADGSPVPEAVVTLGSRREPTDAAGAFAFEGVEPGVVVLAAEKGGRRFGPSSVPVDHADATGVSLRERTFTLSGEITGADASAGVTVTDGTRSTTAVAQGSRLVFSLAGVPGGARALAAVSPTASFTPVDFANPLEVSADRAGLVLAADPTRSHHVAGRVTELGAGVAGATVGAGGRSAVTDDQGWYYVPGLPDGEHTVTVTGAGMTFAPASRLVNIAGASPGAVDFSASRTNAAPFFTQAATASPGADDRAMIPLAARADDDGGAAAIRYTWSTVGAVPAPVTFTANGSNQAADTVAIFSAAGTYRLRATAADARSAATASEVVVTVRPVALRLAVAPLPHPVWIGGTARFSAVCTDQFGGSMAPPAPVSWKATGGGAIDASGLFSASRAGEGNVVTATMGTLVASRTFPVGYPPGPGVGLTQEVWTGLSGSGVASLTSAPAFPGSPGYVALLGERLETLAGTEHDYGQRLRGFFVPPVTGEYEFFIASDNASELWLSSGGDPAGRALIASVPTATGWREWTAFPSQKSAAVLLLAGKAVYLEVLHKEDSAQDHLSVGVRLPGGVFERPIPADRLLPWGVAAFGPPTIVVGASASPAVVGASMSASVAVAAASEGGDSILSYRWEAVNPAPGAVVFLPNGTGAARSSTVRFSRAGDYTLRVVVSDSAGQTAASTVVVRVEETQASWRRRYFSAAELDNPALEAVRWGAEADPDGDGLPNLLEYAFGLDPLAPSAERAPVPGLITVDGVEFLAITFPRNPAASDLEFTPQVSSDLQAWESGLVPVGDAFGNPATFRDARPAREFEKRFMRVHVTAP